MPSYNKYVLVPEFVRKIFCHYNDKVCSYISNDVPWMICSCILILR